MLPNFPRRGRFPRARRCFLVLVFGSGAIAVIATAWLLGHLRPHHNHFLSRAGPLAEAVILEDSVSPEGVRQSLVEVQAESGLTVRFRVIRPEHAAEPLPLVVLLAGHRTGSQAIELIGDPGEMAVAALDYPYDGPRKIRSVWSGISNLGVMQKALLDTPPAVSVALNWLVEESWIDSSRVELIGASLGVPFAAVAGALDGRFKRVWLLHGGADNREWLGATLRERVPNRAVRSAAAFALHLVAHGASFDTAGWVAGIAPRPVVVIGASDDESLTRENIARLHTAAGEPKELLWTSGGHVTRHRPEVVRDLLQMVRERVDDGDDT